MNIDLRLGSCIDVMATLPENSVDTIITDPPYHLTSITKRFGGKNAAPAQFGTDGAFARASKGFMGKTWDGGDVAFQVATWEQAYRVLKPGGFLLAFGGTRTYHRMVCAIEDAGFEIRDMVEWVYGSGFPKSYDIGKGIDKQAGKEPVVIGKRTDGRYAYHFQDGNNQFVNAENNSRKEVDSKIGLITAPSTPEAQLWHGWGTALKPAHEPIVVAMKPVDGTFVNNALTWGVAGLWIDGGRVGTDDNLNGGAYSEGTPEHMWSKVSGGGGFERKPGEFVQPQGRFPANFIHSGEDEVVGLFPHSNGAAAPVAKGQKEFGGVIYGKFKSGGDDGASFYNDSGSAARFFMTCKQDDLCSLCLTPKHSIMSNIDNSEVIQCKSLFANNVEKSLTTTQATTLNIAQESVQDWLIEKAVHFAKSAGNLCEKCATSIVREVVEIKTWDSKNVVSPVIQDFIGNSNKCILIQNLAQYAEIWDSIDTTPTTTSLLTLFGYASRVITNYIQETEKTAPKRFLYSPKASRSERNAGLEGMEERDASKMSGGEETRADRLERGLTNHSKMQNHHPTVKPIELMRYLVRLTKTPTGGVVLDPFMGSGTTGMACVKEGRNFIGIELDEEYLEIAKKRIEHAQAECTQLSIDNLDEEQSACC